MVTFVSQCEKNALKKTRRVLDAFANRIGDNTWQTIITEDGLITVKKMLRQTASKSTAVSCHWIRSRSRSQFLWVVGNKNKFNSEGVVAVNYTEVNDLKMDETPMMNEIVYANTQQQPLEQHLFAVGTLAKELVSKLLPNESKLAQSAFLAGCLHDIGKLDPEFRLWLNGKINKDQLNQALDEDGVHVDRGKFSFEKHPRHNEISLWLIQFLNLDLLTSNKKQRDYIEHTVYWHHAKPIRQDAYINLNDIHRKLKSAYKDKGLRELVEHADLVLSKVAELIDGDTTKTTNSVAQAKFRFDEDVSSDFRKTQLPDYKQYDLSEDIDDYVDQVSINAKANIIRACVITADRIVSALTVSQLSLAIETGNFREIVNEKSDKSTSLTKEITQCLQNFETNYPNSDRNEVQSDVADQLLDAENVAVLNGPAGCGKTKIALEWAKLTEVNKIIWVCPRVQVCEGLFKDLISDEYLPNSKIEICTGDVKETHQNGEIQPTPEHQVFSGDVVLTTIDQIINSITTHTNVTALVDFMSAHIVFDEFHEYIPMPAFNLLFAELVKCKQLQGEQANTLLVSATPHYAFIEQVLEIDSEDIFDCPSFNVSQYQICLQNFDEQLNDGSNPLFSEQPINTIVISNTATTAQLSFIANQTHENAILFHGKFKICDKKQLFESVYQSFKKSGSHDYDVLRSGPIVQASLNITCTRMITEFTVAENWLQRLGRLDRFGENNEVNQFITAIPTEITESNGKVKGNCARFLNANHTYRSAYAWYQFIEQQELTQPVTVNQLYQLYREFYQSEQMLEVIEQDLLNALKDSVKVIVAKVHDPIRFIKKPSSKTKMKLKKSSLRGDSRFVQMAKLLVSGQNQIEFINDYAIDWQQENTDFANCYTESLESIRCNGLIDYVAKKQERVTPDSPIKGIPASKIALRKQVLEGAAVEPEHPIYLSYTSDDLKNCLGEQQPESGAIYYVSGIKQVIGAMSLEKLTNK